MRDGVPPELFQARVNGKPFRCECGCNVFRRRGSVSQRKGRTYICNACGNEYEGSIT